MNDSLTMDSIHARCTPSGDCMLWTGGLKSGRPSVYDPASFRRGDRGNMAPARRVVRELDRPGEYAPRNLVTSCGNPLCLTASHIVTRREMALAKSRPRRRDAVHELLKANPRGWKTQALADRIGLSCGRARELLRELRLLGLAEPTIDGGRNSVWSTPERCKVLRVLAAERTRKLRSAAARRQAAAVALDRWLYPVQRRVSALEAPPIRPAVPMSIFHAALAAVV